MKALSDYHHGGLFFSLKLLIEDRLGGELFRPIGFDWVDENAWQVYKGPNWVDTAGQYLSLNQAIDKIRDADGDLLPEFCNLNASYTVEDGIHYVRDPIYNTTQRAITLEKFKETKFDIIIASMPQHIGPFIELQQKYQPQAKLIYQAGNAWHPDPRIKNFLGSIAKCHVPDGINAAFYHQEMNLEDFRYEPLKDENCRKVRSFVHYMQCMDDLTTASDAVFEVLKKDGFEYLPYGAGMKGDSIGKMSLLGDAMREAGFIIHIKPGGDGFGHNLHAAFAVGRSVVCFGSQYRGKLGSELFKHNDTCIDIDQLPGGSNGWRYKLPGILRSMAGTDAHRRMCERAKSRFDEVVNYDREFETVLKPFFERLL